MVSANLVPHIPPSHLKCIITISNPQPELPPLQVLLPCFLLHVKTICSILNGSGPGPRHVPHGSRHGPWAPPLAWMCERRRHVHLRWVFRSCVGARGIWGGPPCQVRVPRPQLIRKPVLVQGGWPSIMFPSGPRGDKPRQNHMTPHTPPHCHLYTHFTQMQKLHGATPVVGEEQYWPTLL